MKSGILTSVRRLFAQPGEIAALRVALRAKLRIWNRFSANDSTLSHHPDFLQARQPQSI
jgi:hypothetical protein